MGAARTAFTVQVNADRRAMQFIRASNPASGLAFREDQGPGARRLLVASRCDEPGAGFQGRQTPLVMGSRGERSLSLVVVQRRSAWSGWVSGGAGTPPPERMKRRTFLWCDEARCRGSATAWGMQRGRAAAPLPRLWCITPHILHVALNGVAAAILCTSSGRDPRNEKLALRPGSSLFRKTKRNFLSRISRCKGA